MPRRRRVVFPSNNGTTMAATRSSQSTPSRELSDMLESSARIEELSSASEGEIAQEQEEWELADKEEVDDDDDGNNNNNNNSDTDGDEQYNIHGLLGAKLPNTNVPLLFAQPGFLRDALVTETSEKHDKVTTACLDILLNRDSAQEITDLNSHRLPHLQRQKHVKFLRQVLGNYPPPFQVMDASRPWLLYWALAGLSSLGVDVRPYKARTIQTFTPLQNPDGGFGGGHGHLSHCAASYAAVLSLAIVGGLELVDRRSMWRWLGQVKQPDGSLTMAANGETDVRGAYCGMVIHTLLHLPLELPSDSPARKAGLRTFTDGLGEWLGRCQTFEGGIGGAPDNEAHGAYAFCALAALCLLDAPHRSIPRHLNLPRLLSWLSSRQNAPEGSFAGRTNKLVDACYSHWVGGCWALVEAATSPPPDAASKQGKSEGEKHGEPEKQSNNKSLWDREGLVRYTLSCSQAKKGGLRDKPGTRPDGYHTCYSLAGLSAAQNHYTYDSTLSTLTTGATQDTTAESQEELDAAFHWHARKPTAEEMQRWCFDPEDLVDFVHPVFVVPMDVVDATRESFAGKIGF